MSRLGRGRPHRAQIFGPASQTANVTGTVAVTLANFTSSAAGTHISPRTGTVAVTLANFTGTAAGSLLNVELRNPVGAGGVLR